MQTIVCVITLKEDFMINCSGAVSAHVPWLEWAGLHARLSPISDLYVDCGINSHPGRPIFLLFPSLLWIVCKVQYTGNEQHKNCQCIWGFQKWWGDRFLSSTRLAAYPIALPCISCAPSSWRTTRLHQNREIEDLYTVLSTLAGSYHSLMQVALEAAKMSVSIVNLWARVSKSILKV